MFKKTTVIVVIIFALFFYVVENTAAQGNKPVHAPDTLPGVEPEMLTPEYWAGLQDDADKIIMTPDEIRQFNEKVRKKRVVLNDYYGKPNPLARNFALTEIKGPVMNPLLPLDLPDTLHGDSLRVRLKSNIEWLHSRDFYDGRNAIYYEPMLKEIVDAMNIDAVPDVITRRFGIIVNHANIRHYPTSVPGYSETKWEMDMFQATGICLGNPAAILHESADGDFMYVETPISRGWISSKDIAIASREEVRLFTGDENFLMAAAHKVPIYGDRSFDRFARYFYFSAKAPLIRHSESGYVVKMAYRKPDGSLGVANGYVRPDADVHIGYIPYTKRNVLVQFFKLLNTPYGWADQFNKRDCSGSQRVLLRCFGIITGRHPSYILSASEHRVFIDPELSDEDKIAEVSEIEPIITVAGSSGHIVRYLGKGHNGKLYFMHMAGWGYKDENGDQLTVNRVSINAADHSWYRIGSARVFTTIR